MECVYLRVQSSPKKTDDGRDVHGCDIHGQCTKSGPNSPFASCDSCEKKLTLESPNLIKDFIDPLFMVDRFQQQTKSLRNLLAGGAAFLVCGGPSAKKENLSDLNQRGIWSMAVNNMAGFHWPNAFVCSDPPNKFHNGIWQDPNVMKFVPIPKMRGYRSKLREKVGEEFKPLQINGQDVTINECPNVWGFRRRSWLMPDASFFTEPDAAWGNLAAGVVRTGLKKTACTMLISLRILYYLGARTVFLVGVDWGMDPQADLKGNYAFGEHREPGAVRSNNDQYTIAGEWLETLQSTGVFQRFGLQIYNTFEFSRLRAFPYCPFKAAVDEALKHFPKSPFDLTNWYLK